MIIEIKPYGGDGWQVFDGDGKSVVEKPGRFSPSNVAHTGNFIDCIHSRALPNADVEQIHLSTAWCHYGNIAYRAGRVVHVDPVSEGFFNDDEANALVKRTYRPPWTVPETV